MAKSVGLGLQSHRGRGVQITRKFLLLVEVRICILSQGNISESLLINKQLFLHLCYARIFLSFSQSCVLIKNLTGKVKIIRSVRALNKSEIPLVYLICCCFIRSLFLLFFSSSLLKIIGFIAPLRF